MRERAGEISGLPILFTRITLPTIATFLETKAADQGDASAQYNLGVMYAEGQGVRKDDVEAAKWFRKAADQGLARAQYNLGVMYAEGQGVPKDYVEAEKWVREAADQGLALAQSFLIEEKSKLEEAKLIRRHKEWVESKGITYKGHRESHRFRKAYCYSCTNQIDNRSNKECTGCGWIICNCGACGCGYEGN